MHSLCNLNGANDQEADGSLTKNDFIHNYTTVRKEGKETIYWLMVIAEINEKTKIEASKFIIEGNEIAAIISTIIKMPHRVLIRRNNWILEI